MNPYSYTVYESVKDTQELSSNYYNLFIATKYFIPLSVAQEKNDKTTSVREQI